MTGQPLPSQPGWYRNRNNPSEAIYFDGEKFTGHARPIAPPPVVPQHTAPAQQEPSVSPSGADSPVVNPPTEATSNSLSGSFSWTRFTIAALSVALVGVSCVFALKMTSQGDASPVASPSSSVPGSSTSTEPPSSQTATTESEPSTPANLPAGADPNFYITPATPPAIPDDVQSLLNAVLPENFATLTPQVAEIDASNVEWSGLMGNKTRVAYVFTYPLTDSTIPDDVNAKVYDKLRNVQQQSVTGGCSGMNTPDVPGIRWQSEVNDGNALGCFTAGDVVLSDNTARGMGLYFYPQPFSYTPEGQGKPVFGTDNNEQQLVLFVVDKTVTPLNQDA